LVPIRSIVLPALLAATLPLSAGEWKGRLLAGDKPASGVTVSAHAYEAPFDEARREARRGAEAKPLAQTTTGPNGAFTLVLAPEAAKADTLVRLRIEGGGIVAASLEGIWDAAETDDLGDLTFPKAEKLAGKVVDREGAPVADAEVTLTAPVGRGDDTGGARPLPRRTRTAADGTFRFDDASPNGSTLTVEKDGFAPVERDGVRSGAVSRPLVLAPGTALTGTVKKADRKSPAAGALVRFEGKSRTRWVETAEDGSFRIPHVGEPKGALVVDAGDAGWVELPTVKPGSGPIAAVLAPPASLEGRVVDARSGRAVPRTKVEVRIGSAVRLTRSGPDGRYKVKSIPPGRLRLKGDEPRYVPYVKDDVVLAAGEAKKLDVPLLLGATLSGRFTDEEGRPVGGAKWRLTKAGETGIAAFLRQLRSSEGQVFKSAPDGTFKASRLAPGDNQRLSVTHPDFEASSLGGLSLAPGGAKTGVALVLRRGAVLSGVVKDQGGNPVPEAEVALSAPMNFRMGRGGMNAGISIAGGGEDRPRGKTGPDGRFELKGVKPGDYFLMIRKSGYATETIDPVKVAEGKALDPLEVTLAPGALIAGFIRQKNGNGVEGLFVQPAGSRMGRMLGGGAGGMQPTGPDGAFEVEGLKAGETYDLQVLGGGAGMGPLKKGVVAPAEGVEITVSTNGKIAGSAVDAKSGKPLTEYVVSYEPDRGMGGMVMRFATRGGGGRGRGGNRLEVRAEDGRFLLEDVPPGKWQVSVEAKGYQASRVGDVVVEEGATKENVEVKVAPGGALKGRVVDARSGRPIPDAEVSVQGAGGGGGPMMVFPGMGGDGDVTTDADGRFEIEGLAPGKARVTARHGDYAEATESVEIKETGGAVEVRMTTGGSVAGVVVSESRQPLAGAQVSLSAAGESGFGRMTGGTGTVTDASGRFRFDHLGAGRYSAAATLNGKSSPASDTVINVGESKEDLVLTLAAGATVRGTVSGLPAELRDQVSVNVSGPDGFFGSTRSAGDGRFELTGVPAGAITLRATAGSFMGGSTRTASRQLTIAEGQTDAETEIVFEAGHTLSGQVRKGGQGVADAMVFANVQGGGGRSATARTDESGAYRLEGLLDGTYLVQATGSNLGGTPRPETVKLTGDQTLDIDIPTARIAGTVVESGSRQPLPDAVIEVGGDDSGRPFLRAVTTDSNGRFAMDDLDAKAYTLTVRKPDFQFDKRTVTASERDGDALVIELVRGEGIGVQVRDGLYGVPLRGLMARVLDASGTPVFTGSIALDGEGRGDIPSLKPGRYTLVADASGYAAVTLEGVSVPSPTVPIALTPGGTVEIHAGPKTLEKGPAKAQLLTASGLPYRYSIFSLDSSLMLATPVRRLENIAPGNYTLAIDGTAIKAFTVAEGGTTIVETP